MLLGKKNTGPKKCTDSEEKCHKKKAKKKKTQVKLSGKKAMCNSNLMV